MTQDVQDVYDPVAQDAFEQGMALALRARDTTHQDCVDRDLLEAARAGDAEAAGRALDAGADFYRNNAGNAWDAMNFAISCDSSAVIAELVKRGYQINDTPGKGNDTPLIFALRSEPLREQAVRELVRLGANVNGTKGRDDDPLCSCLAYNNKDGVKLMMELGADPSCAKQYLAEHRGGGNLRPFFNEQDMLRLLREGEACRQQIANGTVKPIAVQRPLKLALSSRIAG